MPSKIPKSELENDIIRVVEEVGEPLTQGDYATEGEYTVRTIKNRYGGWNDMKTALGLEKSVQTTDDKHAFTLNDNVVTILRDAKPKNMAVEKFIQEIVRAYLNTGYRGTQISPRMEEGIEILHDEYGIHQQEIMDAFDVSKQTVRRCIEGDNET